MPSLAHTFSTYWNLLTHTSAAEIQGLASTNMGLALIVCFVSGILTSLTPCVYPMIPITINIFGRAAQKESRTSLWGFNPYSFKMACIYVAGMCTTYSIMGVIAGMTGSIFGALLQSAWMLGFLGLLFLVLSLGQLGLFKIQLPVAIQSKLMLAGSASNGMGVFLMGFISGLIVSPCVGPVIAGILAFVFDSSSPIVGLLYFLSFSMGLGVLFLLIGGFSGIVNRIPRSGAWMVRVNQGLAVLLLAASVYYGTLWAKRVGIVTRSSEISELTWLTNEEEARQRAQADGRVLVIDFTADWCEACHVIEKNVFQDPEVTKKLKETVLLRIDLTQNTTKSEEISGRYEVRGLPAIVFVRPDGSMAPSRVTGVLSSREFLKLLVQSELRQIP